MLKLNMTMVLTAFVFVGCSVSPLTTLETQIDTETSSSPTSTSKEAVDRHNEIRAEVFSGADVIWSDEIATTAQEYANYLAVTGKFEHDTNSGYGENLYASSRSAGYVDAINSWYDEKKIIRMPTIVARVYVDTIHK
ncbi:MAG: CAP domain-containing protein [Sulfurovum sp.]|nr:CAP domain-containing protein [Sulfurovum sp.]